MPINKVEDNEDIKKMMQLKTGQDQNNND